MISLQCVNISEVMLAKCLSLSLYSAAALVADSLRKACLMRANKKKKTRKPVDMKLVRFQRWLVHCVKCSDTLV